MKVLKSINVSPSRHQEVRIGAAQTAMTMQDYADLVVSNGVIVTSYLPDGIELEDFLGALQRSLKCSDKKDLLKLIWVKLGNEWPPNIEANK